MLENGLTSVTSLAMQGTGSTYDDFTWAISPGATAGSVNLDQQFSAVAIPEPGTYALLLAGLGPLGFGFRRMLQFKT